MTTSTNSTPTEYVHGRKPKIILFDVEMTHNLVRSYNLIPRYIPHRDIVKERYLICASWKELGKSKIHSVSVLEGDALDDDYVVVKKLYDVLSDCDAVVGHYSDKFDMRVLNARMAYHGFPPLPPIIQIDTYKIAKSKFYFNSNSLDYIGKYLKVGRKIYIDQSLWERCEEGDPTAIRDMVKYNKGDVLLLDRVYKKLFPFVPAKLNYQLFTLKPVCPACGGKHVHSKGIQFTKARSYRRYKCQTCGHPFRSNKAIKRKVINEL